MNATIQRIDPATGEILPERAAVPVPVPPTAFPYPAAVRKRILRAREHAAEHPQHAWFLGRSSRDSAHQFMVFSASHPGIAYYPVCYRRPLPGYYCYAVSGEPMRWIKCNCQASLYGPCWHGGKVHRRIVREYHERIRTVGRRAVREEERQGDWKEWRGYFPVPCECLWISMPGTTFGLEVDPATNTVAQAPGASGTQGTQEPSFGRAAQEVARYYYRRGADVRWLPHIEGTKTAGTSATAAT